MDNYSSADDVQNVDNEAADVATDCLLNPVVVRKVLEYLPSKELRQLSLVNKLWKREARSVMRKRGHLIAYIKSNYFDPSKEFDAFISDLKQADLVPFSGISIRICFDPVLSPFQIAAQDPVVEGIIFDQPSLKTVSVGLSGSWSENIFSPGVLLAKKILQDCSGFLEELELGIDHDQEYFMEKVVQDSTFPRLHILKLRGLNVWSDYADYENYMKALVSRAPNLKVLHSNGCIDMLLRVLQGSSAVPVFTVCICAPFEGISKYVGTAVRFDIMELRYTDPEFDFEMFNRITPMLLRAPCTTTLRSMYVDAVLAVSLMCYGIQLENVKTLEMDIDYRRLEEIEQRILDIVKNFDFTRVFPNLGQIHLDSWTSFPPHSQNHIDEVIQRANVVLITEPSVNRAVRIKNLTLGYSNLSSVAAQFYVEMFPNIEGLTLLAHGDEIGQSGIGDVWNWLDLKDLEIYGCTRTRQDGGNLDSAFCGIFPEEVAELRVQDEDYLKRVNIVPLMPALTCLKNLRTLSLHLHVEQYRNDQNDDATFIFSKVTALLAFARMPALAVSLNLSADGRLQAMTHLRPYVSLNMTHGHLEDEEWDD